MLGFAYILVLQSYGAEVYEFVFLLLTFKIILLCVSFEERDALGWTISMED